MQGGLRESGLELHRKLFRKDSVRVASRESSQSSGGGGFEEKTTQKQVSTFAQKRRPSGFEPKLICKNDFEIGKCKGDGKFGKVYPCMHKTTKTLYALK